MSMFNDLYSASVDGLEIVACLRPRDGTLSKEDIGQPAQLASVKDESKV